MDFIAPLEKLGALKLIPLDTGAGCILSRQPGGISAERHSWMMVVIVLTNFPTVQRLVKLAQELVARRLAACVNVARGMHLGLSLEGRDRERRRGPVLIKTRPGGMPRWRRDPRTPSLRTSRNHRCHQAARFRRGYLQWVADETAIASADANAPSHEHSGRKGSRFVDRERREALHNMKSWLLRLQIAPYRPPMRFV